jgi:hypothetical protein
MRILPQPNTLATIGGSVILILLMGCTQTSSLISTNSGTLFTDGEARASIESSQATSTPPPIAGKSAPSSVDSQTLSKEHLSDLKKLPTPNLEIAARSERFSASDTILLQEHLALIHRSSINAAIGGASGNSLYSMDHGGQIGFIYTINIPSDGTFVSATFKHKFVQK